MENKKYKGWYFCYTGNGYVVTRIEKVNGKTIVRRSDTLKKAKILIDCAETRIRLGLSV